MVEWHPIKEFAVREWEAVRERWMVARSPEQRWGLGNCSEGSEVIQHHTKFANSRTGAAGYSALVESVGWRERRY